jgi:hypothetical protein
MTTHEAVNKRYGELQSLLREHFCAEGRGVIEMVRNIEGQLPATLAWELRSIGHIRNKVVHDGLEQVPRYFDPLCIEAVATLKKLIAESLPKPARASKSTKPSKSVKTSSARASKPAKRATKKAKSVRTAPARGKAAAKKQ